MIGIGWAQGVAAPARRTLSAMSTDGAPERKRRLGRLRETWAAGRQVDPKIGWVSLGVFLAVLAVAVLLGLIVRQPAAFAFVGVPLGALAATIVFGRRFERGSYRMIEGRPGAAGGVLDTLKRGWTITPAVAVTRDEDFVHRAVGRAGVVLVGEGTSPQRVGRLLAQERRRHARVALDTTVVEVVVGNGEGEVPLRRLTRHLRKLPKTLQGSQVTELNSRLRALRTQPVAMPKGPLPRGGRMPKMPRSGQGRPR